MIKDLLKEALKLIPTTESRALNAKHLESWEAKAEASHKIDHAKALARLEALKQ